MAHQVMNSSEHTDEFLEHQRKMKNAKEAKSHLMAFSLSIIFTILAFFAVAGGYSKSFVIPFIVGLGIIQALFQLYIWMHLKDREHQFPTFFIYAGLFAGVVTVLGLLYLVWW